MKQPAWGGGQSSMEEKREDRSKHKWVCFYSAGLKNEDSYNLVKRVESVTWKEEAVIIVTLSVETVRTILLPENWRLIWPRRAGSPLHTGWWWQKICYSSWVCVDCMGVCVSVCVFFTFLVFAADVLSHSLLIASLRTQTDYKHVHMQTHNGHRDTFVSMCPVSLLTCDLHMRTWEEVN